VLINLLENAIKFTKAGSVTFSIEVVETHLPTTAEVTHPVPLHRLRFQIKDNGVGMRPDQLEQIFQPFAQVGAVSQRKGGTGLALLNSGMISQKFERGSNT